jgi:hypothetical protein
MSIVKDSVQEKNLHHNYQRQYANRDFSMIVCDSHVFLFTFCQRKAISLLWRVRDADPTRYLRLKPSELDVISGHPLVEIRGNRGRLRACPHFEPIEDLTHESAS